jgi:xylulose-5-phosphate/fructose-6-phosphate phosphoketolase
MATPSQAAPARLPEQSLDPDQLRRVHAYWRAANFLSVGQIYLYANPLLKEPLQLKHVKPRLLGHWGTTPGLNFIYVHLNRLIQELDLDMIYVAGPGHGGPALVANTYLEGTYSEVYRQIPQNEDGMRRLFTQFSLPGGVPSHVAPQTPGSIHEGASWAMRSRTPMALRLTTRIFWCAASWATVKRKPARWPRAGTRTSF